MLWVRWLMVVFLCSGGSLVVASPGGARLTLLDGSAVVQVGAQAWHAAEGLTLPDGAMIDTDFRCQLLRIEWPDGSALDLGSDSHAMLLAPGTTGGASTFYLLRGWAKFSSPEALRGWSSPLADVAPSRGVVVASVVPGQMVLFAESGEQWVTTRTGGRRYSLRAGEVFSASADGLIGVSARPQADWVAQLPRAFRDTLPLRLTAFNGRDVVPVAAPSPSYADLQPWLVAEPLLRKAFVQRYSTRLRERDFRAAVTAHLRQHPEWAPLLASPRAPNSVVILP